VADIIQLANQYRSELLKNERAAADRLTKTYDRIWLRLFRQLTKINQQIEDARARGEMVNQAWLFRQERYGALLRHVDREFRRFADVAETSITKQQREAATAALDDSVALMAAAADGAGITATFNRLPIAAVENLVGTLGNGSPLSALLDQLPGAGRRIVEQGLIEAVALGIGPAATARKIREGLGGNLTRALTIARTETLRSYRIASSQTYQANADVVEGWYWRSARHNSCAACIALDGTFHKVNEPMRPHPNCRCTLVPAVEGVEVDRGVDWFKRQPASVQRDILGTQIGYDAVKSGALKIEDFVGLKRNPFWGDNYHQLSVKRALAGEGKFPGDAARPAPAVSVLPPAQPMPTNTPKLKRESIPRLTTGAKLRAKLEKIAADTEKKIATLKAGRDELRDRYLETDSYKERLQIEKKIKSLAHKAQKISDDQVKRERRALYQRTKAKIGSKYENDLGGGSFDFFEGYQRRRHAEGLDEFSRMVGSGLLDGRTIRITVATDGRAYYLDNAIYLDPDDPVRTVIHELGHWLEHNNPAIRDAIRKFYARRTAGDSVESLAQLTGNSSYRADEMTKKDRWLNPYMGKWRAFPGGEEGPEILSMGLEWIYNDPLDIARRDPEFFDFIIEVVRLR